MNKKVLSSFFTKKLLLRVGIAVLVLLTLLFIVIGVVLNTILTPQKITPIVLGLTREYVNAEVNCESIDITFFSTFPNLGVKLENGKIINHPHSCNDSVQQQLPSSKDTLITFRQAIVSLNPIAFLFQEKVIIRQLEIENADIYASIDTEGKSNWDIFITTPKEEKEENAKPSEIPELNISNIHFRNIQITYDDSQQDILLMADSLQLKLGGNLSKEKANLDLNFVTKGVTSYIQGVRYSNYLPLEIEAKLVSDRAAKKIVLDNGAFTVGVLKLESTGEFKKGNMPHTLDVNVDFNLNASSLSDLLAMIPEQVSDIPSKVKGEGRLKSNGTISGLLGKEIYPTIHLLFQLTDGALFSFRNPEHQLLDKIELDVEASLDLSKTQPSSVLLKQLFLQMASSEVKLKGNVDNVLENPLIQASAQANINFTELAGELAFLEGMQMGGKMEFDLSTQCYLNDILSSNLGKVDLKGDASVRNVKLQYPQEGFFFFAPHATMNFGSNTQDSIRDRVVESLFRGNIVLDSISVKQKENFNVHAGRFSARFSTSEQPDSTALAPVTGMVKAENVKLTMGDSIRMRAFKTNASIRLSSQKENPTLPEINVRVSLDTLRGLFQTVVGRVHKANLNLRMERQQLRSRVHSATFRRDSTLTQARRDSLRRSRFDIQTDLSFRLESQETRKLLRNWELSGSLGSQNVSLRTPLFPLPLRMAESDLKFTDNAVSLNNARLQIGKSDLSLKGTIEGIKNALLYNGKVSARFALDADSIDFNELIKAAVAGTEYTLKNSAERDSIAQLVLDEDSDSTEIPDSINSGIFVVPRNLDIEFNSNIKNARYSDLTLKNIRGKIMLKDQAVYLSRLMLHSDVGKVRSTLVYKAPNRKGAHLGLDLNMEKTDVKELINAFPMMNSLTPMLRSFEGMVDCNMTAITELDSLMNVKLSSTSASCILKGKNMVLLDGESFSEISKTLMFKKKSRNLIDSLSVEMILEDEKLMIFPFRLSIDRYNVAVGGVQNLDMTFNYHITVLKSPVPFKLGLNITGTPEDMKIRLAKAKYKDLFGVAREEQLANTTINIRKEMEDKLRKSINDIIGLQGFRPVARPKVLLSDSLKQTYFQLDTTTVAVEEGIQPEIDNTP